MRNWMVLMFLLGFVVSPSAFGTFESYLTVIGAKQGKFKGEFLTSSGKTNNQIPISAISDDVATPTDIATGMASGKRQHKPITITKSLGASSIQFYNAMITNEKLSVEIDLMNSGATASQFVIKLTDALVSAIHLGADKTGAEQSVSLTFQKIEYIDQNNSISVNDSMLGQ